VTILASSTLPTIPTEPITRSRAKKIQQEVHALLYEFQLNTNANFMLPKLCMLIFLRFTKYEGHNISRANQKKSYMFESVQRDRTVQKKQSYLLILKCHEDP
jgi:hypothetical protein